MKKINSTEMLSCFGGNGECQCRGTDDPVEQLCGAFIKITANEQECMEWCLNEKGGREWRFIDTGTFDINIFHYLGISSAAWNLFKKGV